MIFSFTTYSLFSGIDGVGMLAKVHTSDCCYGGKGVERHREFAKEFLGKQMWQTNQINPTEIRHPPKSTMPFRPSTLSLIMWLLLSSVGTQIFLWINEGGLCWPRTSVHTWLPRTDQTLHTSMIWWDPVSFPCQLQSGITIPSKTSLLQNCLGRKTLRKCLLTSVQAERDAWEWPANSLGTYFAQGGLAKQRGAGKARSSWQSQVAQVSTGLVTQQSEFLHLD